MKRDVEDLLSADRIMAADHYAGPIMICENKNINDEIQEVLSQSLALRRMWEDSYLFLSYPRPVSHYQYWGA